MERGGGDRAHRRRRRPRRSRRRRRTARRRPRSARRSPFIASITRRRVARRRRWCRCRAARRRSRPRRRAASASNGSGRVARQPPQLLGGVAAQLARAARRPARRRRGPPAAAAAPPPGRRRRCCPCRRRPRSGPAGACASDDGGQPLARALHQVQRRHAALLDRPAVDRPHLLGVGQRLQPARQAHASTATAAAMPCVCVSETLTVFPELVRPPLGRARQPHGRRLVAAAEDLDVAPAPLAQLERLRDRLLGAEPRGQVHRGPRARGRVGALAVGEQPLRQRGAPGERALEAVDLQEVDADAGHGRRL